MKKIFILLLGFINLLQADNQIKRISKSDFRLSDGTSFADFEARLRKKHPNVDIPPIVLKEEGGSAYYKYSTKTMYISPSSIVSPASLEWTIFHETGHHNYPQDKRDKNFDKAVLGVYGTMAATLIPCCKTAMSLTSEKMLSERAFSKSILRGIGILYAGAYVSNSVVFPYLQMRSEEKAADEFANAHASKDALRAQYDKWSFSNFFQRQKIKFEKEFVFTLKSEGLLTQEQEERIEKKGKTFFRNLLPKLSSSVYNPTFIQLLIDPEHPSCKSRCGTIAAALKSRFGFEVKNN